MPMTVTMTTDPAIMVIGNHLIMITGKPAMSMIGKSHHRNILRITAMISMNLQADNNYPGDADDIQDGDVCLAYDDEYHNSGYYDDNQDWDDQYE